jgi:putative membrane protein
MKGIALNIVVAAIAFVILLQILPSNLINFDGSTTQLVILALIVGVVNAVIKPIARLLSFPLSLVTLGLFGFVVNAALMLLVAWVADNMAKLDFTVGTFPPDLLSSDTIVGAFLASILLSIISTAVGLVVHD